MPEVGGGKMRHDVTPFLHRNVIETFKHWCCNPLYSLHLLFFLVHVQVVGSIP